jgi:hypothetical protein
MFILKELLETRLYSKLKLPRECLESLGRNASAPPLPEGAQRVETLKKRLRGLLNSEKKHAKAMSEMPRQPIRGRSRRTLRYDHKRRVSPSRVFENPIQFSNLKYDRHSYKSVDDYLERRTVVLERKLGSASEDSHEEELEARLKWLRQLSADSADELSAGQCSKCGTHLEEETTWYTVVRVSRSPQGGIGSIEPVASSCRKCGIPSQSSWEQEWMRDLAEEELEIYRLHKEGVKQAEIGSRLVPKKSQPLISRILKRIEQKRTTARGICLLKTGGA